MQRDFFRMGRLSLLVLFILPLGITQVFSQQSQAILRGQVVDLLGGIVVGITVTARDASGTERTATTNEEGQYVFPALPPGRYTVRVNTPGFSPYENTQVDVSPGRTEPLDIVLSVAEAAEEVIVSINEENGIDTEPENNSDAVILRGDDLDSLPDDPEDLAEALAALAGPTAGADDEGQIYIDGFTGGRLPPKESIREIRINRNPYFCIIDNCYKVEKSRGCL